MNYDKVFTALETAYNELGNNNADGRYEEQMTHIDDAINSLYCCSECHTYMGPDNCDDEFWDERVCDECSKFPKEALQIFLKKHQC